MHKAVLRKQFLAKRKACTLEEGALASEKICRLFFEHFSPGKPQTLHVFLPILKHCEINTWLIIHKLWADFPEVRIVVPVTNFQTEELEHYLLTSQTEIKESNWGIPEPVDRVPVPEPEIDMVLMPLIAFDLKGNRVGYGKGYYDRFLQQCRPEVLKVGLSLLDPVDLITDVHEADVPLDHCLTPDKRYQFNLENPG